MKQNKKAKNITKAILYKIEENFNNYKYSRETDNEIAMYGVRSDMLFEAIKKLYV